MTKQSEKPTPKPKKELMVMRTLVVLLILLLLYLWMANRHHWWPYEEDTKLGTAFSAVEQSKTAAAVGTTGSSGSTGTSGGNGSSGANGTNGNNGGSTTPSSSSALLIFAAGVNAGDTKADVSGQASGLNEHCVLVVDASTVGKQEVCTYTEGDKIVTVTYLNDHVVSASRSGF